MRCEVCHTHSVPFESRRGEFIDMLRLNVCVRRCPADWRHSYVRNYHAGSTTPSKGDKGMSISQVSSPRFSDVHTVIVAMSGGVDSSVTAKILADPSNVSPLISHYITVNYVAQGHDLSAVFMRNWDTRDESGSDDGCEWKQDWEDVQRVCQMLDIPVKMVRSCSSRRTEVASLESRLILVGNTGSECLSHPSEIGLRDFHRIPMFGATSKSCLSYPAFFLPTLIDTGKSNLVPS